MTSTFVADLPITALPSVGAALAAKLGELGIYRIFDLLMHLPRDYEDKSRIIPMKNLEHGITCLVSGVIVEVDNRRGLSVLLSDGTGQVELKFFHTYPSLINAMQLGKNIAAFGEIKISRFGTQIAHPEYHSDIKKILENGLIPIYPTIKSLHQNKLRQLIRLGLQAVKKDGLYCLGDEELACIGYNAHQNALLDALHAIHLPDIDADIFTQTQLLEQLKDRSHPACRRLILEELTAHQLSFGFRRHNLYQHKAPRCTLTSPLADKLIASLAFGLTDAQKRVINETCHDMAKSKPMLRLVQGDVGAGKTLVAALCACHAIDAGWQVALMAPTEILAEQHWINFKNWLTPLGIGVGFLVGKQSSKERKEQLNKIADNDVQMVIGTHALFQEGVIFAKLGFVIIDEQHRFGVEQRLKLAGKAVAGYGL